MGPDDIEVEFDHTPDPTPGTDQKYDKPIYKQWFRSKDRAGFLSIGQWFDVGKVVVDIGQSNPNTGGLTSHTNVYVNAISLATYLKAVVEGYGTALYPADDRNMVPTPEGITFFGGNKSGGKPVSRVFKISHYPLGQDKGFDNRSFQWKCGHFEANESKSGAFMPQLTKPLSVDSIKVSRVQMAEISYVLNLGLQAHASQNPEWYNHK